MTAMATEKPLLDLSFGSLASWDFRGAKLDGARIGHDLTGRSSR